MEDLTGKQFGIYQIVAPLGEGGMAAVYKAYQPSMERYVAIKVLPRHMVTSEEFVNRFRREAKLLAQLQHPHILPVFDYGEAEGYPYIVMPYVNSGTLAGLLQNRRLSISEVRRIITQLGDALSYAHSLGMIHRDIKPSNVLVDERGNCLLTDFGLARMAEASIKITTSGTVMGTPAYMSPEQGAGSTIDHRSDIYSLGIILYEMVTGRVPYIAETPVAVVFKHIQDPLPSPRKLKPDLSEAIELVLLKALAKSPDDRYQTADDFIQAIYKAIPETSPEEKSPAQMPTISTRPAPELKPVSTAVSVQAVKSRTGVIKYALIGVVVLGTLAAGVWGIRFLGGRDKPTEEAIAISTTTAVVPPPTEIPIKPAPQLPVPFKCTDPLGCIDVGPADPIHIAYALVISGPDETLGIDSRTGAEVAIALKGKLLGHEIQFTGEDDGCSPEGGQSAGAKLAADPTIVAVIGTSCSSAARVAVPLLSQAGFVIISPSNTAPDLTQPGNPNNHPGYLRTAHNDEVQGAVAAHFAFEKLGITRAATIHDGSLYAQSLQEVFAKTFRELGGTITTQEAIDPNHTDFKSVLTSISTTQPEFIYYPVFIKAGSLITRQIREISGLENIYIMGADGMFSPDAVEGAGDAIEGLYVSSPDLSSFSTDYQAVFLPKYKELAGTDPISVYHAHAFDAVNMIFAAIEKVAIQDPDGILHIPRQALRETLFATSGFHGLTGNLTCAPTGDCADPKIAIYEYHAGQYPPNRIWP